MSRVIGPIDHSTKMVLLVAALLIAAWTTLVLGWLLFFR
jgi:hypothetical protein